jgi:hypothetical protein
MHTDLLPSKMGVNWATIKIGGRSHAVYRTRRDMPLEKIDRVIDRFVGRGCWKSNLVSNVVRSAGDHAREFRAARFEAAIEWRVGQGVQSGGAGGFK